MLQWTNSLHRGLVLLVCSTQEGGWHFKECCFICRGGGLDVLETFKEEICQQRNCTAGYIFGLLDSRTPKPNLSNRGTTLLLLMLQRGTKTRVRAPLVSIRVRATLATKQASSTSSAEEPAPPRSGNDDPAKGLGRTVAGHPWPRGLSLGYALSCVALFLLEPPVPCTPRNCRGLIRTAFSFIAQERPCSEWNWEEREAQSPTLRAASRAPRNSPQTLGCLGAI